MAWKQLDDIDINAAISDQRLLINPAWSAFEVIDEHRADSVFEFANDCDWWCRSRARDLAQRLSVVYEEEIPQTLASSWYAEMARVRLSAALLNGHLTSLSTFAGGVRIASSMWRYSAAELVSVEPRRIIDDLRNKLARSCRYSGYLGGALKMTYHRGSRKFQLEFFGIAGGEMLLAIDRLRAAEAHPVTRRYDPRLGRMSITVSERFRLPNIYARILVGAHVAKPVAESVRLVCAPANANTDRHHVHGLLWLDRWSLKDISLIIGLRTSSAGFTSTSW